MGLYSEGLIIGRLFANRICRGGGGGAYVREGLFLEGPVIGILRYNNEGECFLEKTSLRVFVVVVVFSYSLQAAVFAGFSLLPRVWKYPIQFAIVRLTKTFPKWSISVLEFSGDIETTK